MDFLALIFLVVYVGAIAVLFLFVVMMLNIRIVELTTDALNYLPMSALLSFGIVTQSIYFIYNGLSLDHLQPQMTLIYYTRWVDWIDSFNNIDLIGQVLFTFNPFPFILTGFILLVAMLGSIIITLSHRAGVRRQSFFLQNERKALTLTRHLTE
jgi:NADH:ubiquinone oxidoreductase subunit 6 (subunit J)